VLAVELGEVIRQREEELRRVRVLSCVEERHYRR
jgi:hypothetical protein